MGESEILTHGSWECTFIQSLWRTIWHHPGKLKTGTDSDPAMLLARKSSRVGAERHAETLTVASLHKRG